VFSVKIVFRDFRIVDAFTDMAGDVIVEGGGITAVIPRGGAPARDEQAGGGASIADASIVLDGRGRLVLSSGFVDMHAHFREPGFSDKETLESGLAELEGAPGGFSLLGRALIKSALAREESRGSHNRMDFPNKNDAEFRKTTVASYNGGKVSVRFEGVPEWRGWR
jgi:hypothetical protein